MTYHVIDNSTMSLTFKMLNNMMSIDSYDNMTVTMDYQWDEGWG